MDGSNQPLSEQFRLVAKQWVKADNTARLLEDTKSSILSERMGKLGDVPVAHAKRDVEGSEEWRKHIEEIVTARTEANKLKMQLEYIKMQHSEQQSFEATRRSEMRL